MIPHSKVCRKCLCRKKPDGFYTHKAMKDGHLNICKKCVRLRVLNYRKRNVDKIRIYDQERNRARILDPIYKMGRKEYLKRYYERFPNRKKARILSQRIPRASSCLECGESSGLINHHPDYRKPRFVVTICRPCHSRIHNEKVA